MFAVQSHSEVPMGQVGFSLPQRKWAVLSLNQDIRVRPYPPEYLECLSSMTLEVDFLQKKR